MNVFVDIFGGGWYIFKIAETDEEGNVIDDNSNWSQKCILKDSDEVIKLKELFAERRGWKAKDVIFMINGNMVNKNNQSLKSYGVANNKRTVKFSFNCKKNLWIWLL